MAGRQRRPEDSGGPKTAAAGRQRRPEHSGGPKTAAAGRQRRPEDEAAAGRQQRPEDSGGPKTAATDSSQYSFFIELQSIIEKMYEGRVMGLMQK